MGWGGRFSKKPYFEQFERTQRWYEILNKIRVSNAPEEQADYQVDNIYAFFMNCHHLRDWIINSKVLDQKKVDDFRNLHIELKICRDLCNGPKHLKLDHPSIGDPSDQNILGKGVTLHKEYVPFGKSSNTDLPLENSKYVIIADFKKFDVFKLADKCMELWEKFLKDNSLL